MDVSALAGISSSGSAKSAASLAENFDTFLKLLTTQLQYQDPLNPMESNEFTQQLVQFAGVEQQIQANQNLERALGLLQANYTATAVAYIGKQVEAAGDAAWLAEEGGATWGYELNAPASVANLLITDSKGKLVYAAPAAQTVGRHQFAWDGFDLAGQRLPEGTYTFSVAAVDRDGRMIEVATSVVGTVTAVQNRMGEALLLLGRTEAPLVNVIKVEETGGAA